MIHQTPLASAHLGAVIDGVILLLILIFKTFFSWSCYKTLKTVPEQARYVPVWFPWLFLIPGAGYVFQWIMMPFAIPKSIKNATSDRSIVERANVLFGIGLAYVILIPFVLIPYAKLIFGISIFVLWAIYWINVSEIGRLIMADKTISKSEDSSASI